MKYVAICGGLGNQMFQFAYCEMLNKLGYRATTFVPNYKWEHAGGFELERVFGIKHKSGIWERLYNFGFPFTRLFTLFYRQYSGRNFKVINTDLNPSDKYGYFYGTWQSERYLIEPEDIKANFKFSEDSLSKETKRIANILRGSTATICVHIRRGDYQSTAFSQGFGNCCSIEYYQKALSYMRERLPNAKYIFFSDDMQWVKDNFKIDEAMFIDHNHGVESWQDMYLMSLCSHNIIANSTFSWWGAWLNNNPDKIVIAPKRWWSTIEHDDVVPSSWIRL